MNALTGLGLLLLAGSYVQLLLPARLFAHPAEVLFGLPVIPTIVLGLSAVSFTLGVILIGEGMCRRFGAPTLWTLATTDPARLGRVALSGAAAGLAMEMVAQWLGRLWLYPYWTVWFYALVVVPGFAFYWLSVVESYLAVKAVLDAVAGPGQSAGRMRFGWLAATGVIALAVAAALYLRWYADGYALDMQRSTGHQPPVWYALLAFGGLWAAAEGLLSRWKRPSLLGSILRGYWTPVTAIVLASVLLGALMEPANAVHTFWAYQGWPDRGVAGVPLSVFAAWPVQYVAFLILPSVTVPELAVVFWRWSQPVAANAPRRNARRSPAT